MAEMSLML